MMLIHLREQQNQIFRSFYNYFFVYLFFGKDYEILHQNRFPTFLRSKHLFIFLYMKKARNRVLGASQQIKKQERLKELKKMKIFFPFGKKWWTRCIKKTLTSDQGGIGKQKGYYSSQKLQIPSAFLNWISILP